MRYAQRFSLSSPSFLRITATEARRRWFSLLARVSSDGLCVLIFKNGLPIAVLVPKDFPRLRKVANP